FRETGNGSARAEIDDGHSSHSILPCRSMCRRFVFSTIARAQGMRQGELDRLFSSFRCRLNDRALVLFPLVHAPYVDEHRPSDGASTREGPSEQAEFTTGGVDMDIGVGL